MNGHLEGRDRSLSKGTGPTLVCGTEEYQKKLSDAQWRTEGGWGG